METSFEKGAAFNPRFLQGFKNVTLASKPLKAGGKAPPLPVNGTAAARVGEEGTERMFSPEEIAEKIRERDIGEGNGLVGDIVLGSIKGIGNMATRAIKKDKGVEWAGSSAIDSASAKLKETTRDLSTRSGQQVINAIGGNKPGSLRGKLFSTIEEVPIGERTLPDGTVAPIFEKQRRASLLAPIQNTAKVGGPLLGSMYLAEKLYPLDERGDSPTVGEMTQTAQQFAIPVTERVPGHMPRIAMDIFGMEKQAMLDKQAELEGALLAKTAQIDTLSRDLDWMEKRATEADERATTFEKRAASLQDELNLQRAEHEELVLRTAARERSAGAVKVARAMLETGLIKQAEYERQVDKLMDCSEDELLLFEKMASSEKVGEESIESLAFLSDTYNSSDEPSRRRVEKGLSKSGQTIFEAAREINASRNGG